MKLESVPFQGVSGMDFVYGIMAMHYASSSEPVYEFIVQGVYVASTGDIMSIRIFVVVVASGDPLGPLPLC